MTQGRKIIPYTVRLSDLNDYFDMYIQLLNSAVPEQYKLTYKERRFLVLSMLFQYNGGNLSDFQSFQEYILKERFCTKTEHVSMYKHKLSVKKWVKTGRADYSLGKGINILKGQEPDIVFKLSYGERQPDTVA